MFMYWLAINREPIQFEELIEDLVPRFTKIEVRGALNHLCRGKLLIEETAKGFTLQPAIMDYLTDEFVGHICQEIFDDTVSLLNSHCLLKSQAKNYIKKAQILFIIQPIKHKLLEKYGNIENLENRFKAILQSLRDRKIKTGYAAGNILNLLINTLEHQPLPTITDYNFSYLPVHQADLTQANLHNVDFTNANQIGRAHV